MPGIVGPNPGADTIVFNLVDEKVEIVPPQFMLSDNSIKISLLMASGFFVISEVEKSGSVEKLADILYKFTADLVVCWR